MPNTPRAAKAVVTAPEPPAAEPPAYVWLKALGIAAIGAFVGMILLHYRNPPRSFGFSTFAVIYVLAQGIERLLEVFGLLYPLGGDSAAAKTPEERARLRAGREAMYFGFASALAMVACGYFGFGVLHAFGDNGWPRYVDVIVTGLGVGGATKPLHDLITIAASAARTRKAA